MSPLHDSMLIDALRGDVSSMKGTRMRFKGCWPDVDRTFGPARELERAGLLKWVVRWDFTTSSRWELTDRGREVATVLADARDVEDALAAPRRFKNVMNAVLGKDGW